MTAAPTISFLVPTYNGGKYLVTAIESVVDQLVEGDEVLIQDGASKDGSIDDLRERFPGARWLKIVSEPDDGQADALARALERAENAYVMWLNADDIVYPGALAAVRAALDDGPDIACGRSTIFTNDGRIVRSYTPGPITRRAFLGHGSDLFTGSLALRTSLVREAGGFDAKYQYCMDVDMLIRVAEREPIVKYVDAVVGGLRWHEESKGGTTTWPIVREATEIKLRHARTLPERAIAVGSSAAYLLAIVAQPVRHSKLYSAARSGLARRNARSRPAPTEAS